ncbi:MAG TPA: single-stranded-DNA-specific exonuclease RecJ [Candidatus Merdiplasma excrementigallinarum]|uniref:Single-stranded-DNA-specific exonuclease RecJ n=1 Tax=Candidatus Merdiplasma excrementigallinarum TaxID=2840864 RepID=A0A9D1P0T9_9FIRM|nr:single-stranded-DNA-specific exonuclease RecJ [Candidatus Merdiplasma excrementigallinarum]
MEKWYIAAKRADFQAIGEKFHIDQVIARIIRNRDVVGDEAIDEYLNGTLEHLHSPELLNGCREAADLLLKKIEQKKKIRIIGDYDIDGVNATYILYRGLRRLGARVDYEIPDRMKDGYGLNIHLVELARGEGADTILTCDNGITALEQTEYAKKLGMTMIITDHHEPLYEEKEGEKFWKLPRADVLIDPKLESCRYPFKKLCGAAVAWKLIQMLYQISGLDPMALEFLPFAAIATVGDVMELEGENRIMVKWGLKALEETKNPGLRALIRETGLEGSSLSAYHIGFVIGPCINASGRLDTAKRSLRLLLAEDEAEARELAVELKQLNDERKDLTARGVEQAVMKIEHTPLGKDRVLVVYLPGCHESIAGIIAGRIREKYHKPVFVLTDGTDCVKGSGRSIETYSMFDEMVKCQDLFLKFGGHPMAAGLSLPGDKVEEFRRRINEACTLTEEDFVEKVMIDVPMPIDYITEELIGQLSLLEPFGKGNTKPLFAERDLKIQTCSILGKNKNVVKMTVWNQGGTAMEALYFGDVETFLEDLQKKWGREAVEKLLMGQSTDITLSVTYYPSVNEFRGRRTLQIVIQNYR